MHLAGGIVKKLSAGCEKANQHTSALGVVIIR